MPGKAGFPGIATFVVAPGSNREATQPRTHRSQQLAQGVGNADSVNLHRDSLGDSNLVACVHRGMWPWTARGFDMDPGGEARISWTHIATLGYR